ncbi:hypothetical protein PCE1_001591 [Barthelona sp. PCE]
MFDEFADVHAAQRKMTDYERLTFSPFQKLQIFGKFPWKFCMHLIVALLCAYLILKPCNQYSLYVGETKRVLQQHFLLDDMFEYEWVKEQLFRFHDLETIIDQVNYTTEQYYKFPRESLTIFQRPWTCPSTYDRPYFLDESLYLEHGCEMLKPSLQFISVDHIPADINITDANMRLYQEIIKSTHELDSLGYGNPFIDLEGYQIKELFSLIDRFQMKLRVVSFDIMDHGAVKYVWDFLGDYDVLQGHGVVLYTLESEVGFKPPENVDWRWGITFFPLRFTTDALIILISFMSIVLGIKAIISGNSLHKRVKRRQEQLVFHGIFPEDFHEQAKIIHPFAFIDFWFIIQIIGNIFNIIGAVADANIIIGAVTRPQFVSILNGVGGLLAWFNLTRYLEYFSKYYVLINTFKKAAPMLSKFMVSIIPVYGGYAAYGYMVFGSMSSRWFGSYVQSIITLFCMMNGDQMRDIFDEMYAVSPTASRIFGYTFVILFIYAVLNIFIVICEHAYHVSQFEMEEKSKANSYFEDYRILLSNDLDDLIMTNDIDEHHFENLSRQQKTKLKNFIKQARQLVSRKSMKLDSDDDNKFSSLIKDLSTDGQPADAISELLESVNGFGEVLDTAFDNYKQEIQLASDKLMMSLFGRPTSPGLASTPPPFPE